jgi:hypothetical protein
MDWATETPSVEGLAGEGAEVVGKTNDGCLEVGDVGFDSGRAGRRQIVVRSRALALARAIMAFAQAVTADARRRSALRARMIDSGLS